jgi:Protein of unknown function (DUF3460)
MSLAQFFGLTQYRSETTQFIDELKRTRPELDEQQRAGRALLWDRPIDRDLQQEFGAGRVDQKPYVYQTQS